ncbi:hypothetical protein ACQ86E_04655 [Bradyrhizobium betae]|uniref:hypothetical protein n=1 Tax=Bradyrhizobium betae TaxID=244734 RepID=UPI003D679F36
MNAPWVRHLRRSFGVRSLNFFQGMPLVSAGGDVSPHDFESLLASLLRDGSNAMAVIPGHFCLISFIF